MVLACFLAFLFPFFSPPQSRSVRRWPSQMFRSRCDSKASSWASGPFIAVLWATSFRARLTQRVWHQVRSSDAHKSQSCPTPPRRQTRLICRRNLFSLLNGTLIKRKLVIACAHLHPHSMSTAVLGGSTLDSDWAQHECLGTRRLFVLLGLPVEWTGEPRVSGKRTLVWPDSKMSWWVELS